MGEKVRFARPGQTIDVEPDYSGDHGMQGVAAVGAADPTIPGVTITGFTLSSLPWWAWVTVGVAGGLMAAWALPRLAKAFS